MFKYIRNHPFKSTFGLIAAMSAGVFFPPLFASTAASIATQILVSASALILSIRFFSIIEKMITAGSATLSKTTKTIPSQGDINSSSKPSPLTRSTRVLSGLGGTSAPTIEKDKDQPTSKVPAATADENDDDNVEQKDTSPPTLA